MTNAEITARIDKAAELLQPIGTALEETGKDPYPADLIHNLLLELAATIEED